MPPKPQQDPFVLWTGPGPGAKRSQAIDQATWEKYKGEIFKLYQIMTLENLMGRMKAKHGFAPSRRQYIFQFDKWRFHKYKTLPSEKQASSSLQRLSTANDHGSTNGNSSQHNIQPQGAYASGKRPWERLDAPIVTLNKRRKLDALKSLEELDDAPIVTLNKHRKLDALESLEELDDDQVLLSDSPPTLEQKYQACMPSRPAECQFMSNTWANEAADVDTTTSIPPITTYNQATGERHTPSGHSESLRGSEREATYSDRGTNRPYSADQEGPSVVQASEVRRILDSSRLIDTFTSDEILDMKRSANFLFALGSREDSFPLYVQLLKHAMISNTSTLCSWMRVACARSATTPSQFEIVEHLLGQSRYFKPSEGRSLDLENFVLRIELAYRCNGLGDRDVAKAHTATALKSKYANRKIFTHLPEENRSLDLVAYFHLVRDFGYYDDLIQKQDFRPPSLDKRLIQANLMRRKPGPFELQKGYMENPCLRSCLQWCHGELDRASAIPSTITLELKCLMEDFQESNRKESLAIYYYLWERWQSSGVCELWAANPENYMGISASELLRILCRMIQKHSRPFKNLSWVRAIREPSLLIRIQRGVQRLSALPDEVLGHEFLDSFSSRYKWATYSPSSKMLKIAIHTYERAYIQKRLLVELPQVPQAAAVAETTEPPDLQSQPDNLLPSLHSSDLAHFRLLKQRIKQNLKDGISISLPSSGSFVTNVSLGLPSIDELSSLMASSLSIISSTRDLSAPVKAIDSENAEPEQ